jgi:hypothetical protein
MRLAVQWLRRLAVGAGLAGLVATASAATANAYGTEHLFEITLSYNCQNIPVCDSMPFGVGGIWGWYEPDAGGGTDGQIQLQGHQNTIHPFFNASLHDTAIGPWSRFNCAPPSPPPSCALVAFEGVPTDSNNTYFLFPTTFPVPGPPFPIVTPATAGHYSVRFGPGIFSNATVTQLT